MRNIDTEEVRLFYHGENTSFYEAPPLIDNQFQLEQQIKLIDSADIFQSALLQRPNTKWRLIKIVGFAVTIHPIIGRTLGLKGVQLPAFINNLKCIISLVNDRYGIPYDDNLCLLRAICLANYWDKSRFFKQSTCPPTKWTNYRGL